MEEGTQRCLTADQYQSCVILHECTLFGVTAALTALDGERSGNIISAAATKLSVDMGERIGVSRDIMLRRARSYHGEAFEHDKVCGMRIPDSG